jgi:S-adenosylmethionine-diacylgycerolhomoserine-N-methlytransferase
MDPSTSLASPDERFALPVLARFYRWNAPIYDWTRPFILWGRRAVLGGLDVRPGHRALDVGCGTGWSLPHLLAAGAQVTGIEPSPSMRRQAEAKLARHRLAGRASLCEAPFGGDDQHRASADRVLFSYSLSMIPPFEDALHAARAALRPGGRIAVVDFLDALPGVDAWLRRSHVALGGQRLETLRRLFPVNRCEVRLGAAWRYYLFWGETDSSAA